MITQIHAINDMHRVKIELYKESDSIWRRWQIVPHSNSLFGQEYHQFTQQIGNQNKFTWQNDFCPTKCKPISMSKESIPATNYKKYLEVYLNKNKFNSSNQINLLSKKHRGSWSRINRTIRNFIKHVCQHADKLASNYFCPTI